MDYNKIGNAIKKLRTEAGYTQHELADCLAVTDKAVSKWERGLSVPDISIVMRLANLLNCDIDNLLEGNISYLVKNWQGLMILDKESEVHCGTEVYGKPVVYFLLSYFILAGIRNIYVLCSEREQIIIRDCIGTGEQFGICLEFICGLEKLQAENTMVVCGRYFIYGPNLTRYFQRAMSRTVDVSILTKESVPGSLEAIVYYDSNRRITDKENKNAQNCIPVWFFPGKWIHMIGCVNNIQKIQPLYAEPMDNGMIAYELKDVESVLDTAIFIHYMKKKMRKNIYDLAEVARNRFFID